MFPLNLEQPLKEYAPAKSLIGSAAARAVFGRWHDLVNQRRLSDGWSPTKNLLAGKALLIEGFKPMSSPYTLFFAFSFFDAFACVLKLRQTVTHFSKSGFDAKPAGAT